jgi:hypothetical protein
MGFELLDLESPSRNPLKTGTGIKTLPMRATDQQTQACLAIAFVPRTDFPPQRCLTSTLFTLQCLLPAAPSSPPWVVPLMACQHLLSSSHRIAAASLRLHIPPLPSHGALQDGLASPSRLTTLAITSRGFQCANSARAVDTHLRQWFTELATRC